MFNSLNSLPMNIRPRSDINRIKAIQNDLNKNSAAEANINKLKEPICQLQQSNQINRIAPTSEKKEKNNKSDVLKKVNIDPNLEAEHPEKETKKESKQESKTEKENYSGEKLISIIDQKFKQYIDTISADNKSRKSDESSKKINKNYEELKSFVEQKLSVIDDLANFIRKQKNENELTKKLINVDESKIIKESNTETLIQGENKPEIKNKENKYKAKIQPSRIRAAANDVEEKKEDKKLLNKKKKRTFFEITDDGWETIKNDFPDLREEDKSRVYSDGVENYIEIKGKKIPLDYKAILKLNKENKKTIPKKQERVTVKPAEPKKQVAKESASNPKIENKKLSDEDNDDEELEREIDKQLKEEDEFKQRKQLSKDERLAYLNQLKKERRDMIRKQKLAEKNIQDESDEDGDY